MNLLKKKERVVPRSQSHHISRYNAMSTKTKEFICKICYKKTASVDMTQHGFINDRKMHPVNILMKPLKEQLEKICGKRVRKTNSRRQSPAKREKGLSSPKAARKLSAGKRAQMKEKGKQERKRLRKKLRNPVEKKKK